MSSTPIMMRLKEISQINLNMTLRNIRGLEAKICVHLHYSKWRGKHPNCKCSNISIVWLPINISIGG